MSVFPQRQGKTEAAFFQITATQGLRSFTRHVNVTRVFFFFFLHIIPFASLAVLRKLKCKYFVGWQTEPGPSV